MKNSGELQNTKERIYEALSRQQVPQTQKEYMEYIDDVRQQIEKKYENLIKNAH